jgi:hypothetical protein
VEELARALSRHRFRIKTARVLGTAVRWTFYGSLAALVALAASRIGGISRLRPVAAGLLLLVPLGMAARELLRRFTVRDCALHLDRTLGLEERLATAVEGAGALRDLQLADAAGALARARLPRSRPPAEAKLLFGSLLLMGAILAIPTPERSVGSGDPALAAVLAEEAGKLEALGTAEAEFKEVSALAQKGRAEEALAKLQALRERLGQKMLEGGPGAAQAQSLLDQATASATALSAELVRLGRPVHAPPPVIAALKLVRDSRNPQPGPAPEFAQDASTARFIAAELDRSDWNPKYDSVIRRYFGSKP